MLETCEHFRVTHLLGNKSTHPYQAQKSRYCWEQSHLGSLLLEDTKKHDREVFVGAHSYSVCDDKEQTNQLEEPRG
jgi:hypothetical protein